MLNELFMLSIYNTDSLQLPLITQGCSLWGTEEKKNTSVCRLCQNKKTQPLDRSLHDQCLHRHVDCNLEGNKTANLHHTLSVYWSKYIFTFNLSGNQQLRRSGTPLPSPTDCCRRSCSHWQNNARRVNVFICKYLQTNPAYTFAHAVHVNEL